MKKYTNSQARRGFTLIELLVVIAIIAILAAILFPVFASAKKAAKATQCLSACKQFSLAGMMYAEANDDKCVPFWYSQTATQNPTYDRIYWFAGQLRTTQAADYKVGLLYPYLKSRDILSCPEAKDMKANGGVYEGFSYGFNLKLDPGLLLFNVRSPQPVLMSAVENPADTVFFGDSGYYRKATTGYVQAVETTGAISGPSNQCSFHGRHGGKGNIAWIDGHAKSFKVTPLDLALALPSTTQDDVDFMNKNNLGDLIYPGCPRKSACQDYYFLVDKPN